MSDTTITFLVLAAVVPVFVSDRIPVAIVALGAALSLWATGVLSLDQSLAGFGDPIVLFIASLFVVSEGLEATGVTLWAAQELIARAGERRSRLLVLMMLLTGLVAALISMNAAVAALVPVAVVIAVRLGRSPSQLLMPVAFAAQAGSLLLLTGTPVNVIVSQAAVDAGVGGFGFFEFALVGLPLLVAMIVIVVLFGARLVPTRHQSSNADDFSDHARALVEQYALDESAPDLLSRRMGVAEVVIPPRSSAIGDTVFPGMVTDSGDLVVLAVQRRGQDVGPETTTLEVGDTLLLQGTWSVLDRRVDDADLLAVDSPEMVRRKTVALGPGSKRAIVILLAMVILLATGAVPPAVAGLLAAGATVLSGVLTVEQAYRGISWTTVILIGGMIPLSTAMTHTGAANQLADDLISIVGGAGPQALLLGLFLLTAMLGQLISNMATALIVIPIALSAAGDMHVSAKPVLMAVTVSAAAPFLTPVATPGNLIVMGPGGYRFGDYWKLGLPLVVLFGVGAVLLVPVFWSL